MLLPPAGTGEKEGNRLWQHCCAVRNTAVVPSLTVKRVTRYSKTITSSHNRTALALSLQDYLIPQSTARSPVKATRLIGGPGQEPCGQWESPSMTSFSEPVAADKVCGRPSHHAVTAQSIYTVGAAEAEQTPRRCLTAKFRLVWRFWFVLSDSVTSLG